MRFMLGITAFFAVSISLALATLAQDAAGENTATEPAEPPVEQPAGPPADETGGQLDKIADQVNESETAKKTSAGILNSIYLIAEYLSFSAFHWLVFAIMVTGVVSFALQIVLAKLVVLAKGSISLTEILSDSLGLVISLLGLVLTTQAATENSSFTESPAAVLSATAIGVVLGLIFYWWGQSQEVQAARGRLDK